jgi:uncharacterized protein (DUF1684 family)
MNRGQIYSYRMKASIFTVAFLCINFAMVGSLSAAGNQQTIEAHYAEVKEWREKRHARLSSDDGWLTLVGLAWLQDGENRVGKGKNNEVHLPGGPDYWGTVFLEETGLRFERADVENVTVDGTLESEISMVADTEGTATVVQSGSLSFHPIFRQSYALRIKDSQAPALAEFTGVQNYPVQWNWRVEGRLIPVEEGTTIEIANVLGQLKPSPVMGIFAFEREGETFRLLTLEGDEPDNVWVIFTDRTNSKGTYGAGRFVYSEEVTGDGRLVVDFNKAYNPPCAFNEFSTCPLPPQENRLNLWVTAGEKDFHVD